MQQNNLFSNWFNSPYYHLLYRHRNDIEAKKFINNLTNYLQLPAHSKILDVACGKGRHSIALANKGFDVVGIDLAADSIAAAQEFERDNLHFFVHDMRLPFYINYFDVAVNLFTSFGYFNTQREHNNAIRTMAQSVVNNGTIVIDYINAKPNEIKDVIKESRPIDDYFFTITKWQTAQHFYKKIEVKKIGNDSNFSHLYTERVAKFSFSDFEKMLAAQNIVIKNVLGNYELDKYDIATSPRLIIVATKSN